MKIAITFFLHGQPHSTHAWPFVPRVGDEVLLDDEGSRSAFVVKRVLWGTEHTRSPWHCAKVDIERGG